MLTDLGPETATDLDQTDQHVLIFLLILLFYLTSSLEGKSTAFVEVRIFLALVIVDSAIPLVTFLVAFRHDGSPSTGIVRVGAIVATFLIAYGLFRLSLENVRNPDLGMPDFPFGLTMGMMLSAPMILAGGWLLWKALKEPIQDEAEAREPA